MKGIAMFGSFKGAEHDYSEVFYLFPSENVYSSRTKRSLGKKTQKYVLVCDMTMKQLYALKYVRLQLLDKLFPNHWGYDMKMLRWSTFVAAIVTACDRFDSNATSPVVSFVWTTII